MNQIIEALGSKKLMMSLAVIAVVLLNKPLSLGIDQETVRNLVLTSLGYLMAQGGVDLATALKKENTGTPAKPS